MSNEPLWPQNSLSWLFFIFFYLMFSFLWNSTTTHSSLCIPPKLFKGPQ